MKTTTIILALFLCVPVILEWDANIEGDLKGYKVYSGGESQTYNTPKIILGNTPTYTLNLPLGTHYMAVTAFNMDELESDFSNEVSFTFCPDVTDLQKVVNDILAGDNVLLNDMNADDSVNALDVQVAVNSILGITSCP
jgi:hypothetical protein